MEEEEEEEEELRKRRMLGHEARKHQHPQPHQATPRLPQAMCLLLGATAQVVEARLWGRVARSSISSRTAASTQERISTDLTSAQGRAEV